ncbi:hypothetical protein OM306_11270 [Escherichia albertii]|uniref:hypothetical protein n=1 Tax=Escherichia albertii TaxID=208962 RepID=UPI00235EE646|nr:hypothetical protein [Escherichia albertii]MCZ8909403.1 hypothetical protein [Escherichia albertii]MCZ8938213.1 hypothetical protein [Escherichia albertii]MCZ8942726.1 hypothetical protein [Escherichia albertii]MCZ8947854.1 hypothetical protein [Escherichia albertii]MCZ8953250.1 hypothetical protein [Escherichia albertii]
MNIKPIRTEQDYEGTLRAVEPMFDNEPEMNTPENAENVPTLSHQRGECHRIACAD